MAEELLFEANEVSGVTVVKVGPRLDIETVPEVRKRLKRLIDGGARAIVLDLENVEYLSSFGLSMLVTTAKELWNLGGGFALARPRPITRELLDITKLGSKIRVCDTIQEAAEAAADGASNVS